MFDLLLSVNNTEYGIIKGSDRLLYIKAGNGGTVYGQENRYLRIAKEISAEYGWSVLVASNPTESSIKDCMINDTDFINRTFPDAAVIYAFGHSKGGQMLASYAYLNPKIKRVLAVNAPLMINLHKTKDGIGRFEGERLMMLYGEKDQSVRYVDLLKTVTAPHFGYATVKDADHNFEDMPKEFISLPKRFLF